MKERLEILANFTGLLKAELLKISYEDKEFEAIHSDCFELECKINDRINSILRSKTTAGNGTTAQQRKENKNA
jgi:hypothetical protein